MASAPPPRPAPASSRAGLFVGLAAVGFVVLLVVVGAGVFAYRQRTGQTQAADGSLGSSAGTKTSAPPTSAPPGTVGQAADPGTAGEAGTGSTPVSPDGRSARGATNDSGPGTAGAPDGPGAAAGGTSATNTGAAPPTRETGSHPSTSEGPKARPGTTSSGETSEPTAAGGNFRFLDEELPEADGRAAGERLAEGYKNQQGYHPSRGTFGTNQRFRQRPRSPRDLGPIEGPAVATIRHLMSREELFHKKEGRYGTMADLARGSGLALDVPFAATSFQRKGYRFELSVEEDGFKVTAVPVRIGPRAFVGDDSGYIRAGVE
jgi:hypothetical protein